GHGRQAGGDRHRAGEPAEAAHLPAGTARRARRGRVRTPQPLPVPGRHPMSGPAGAWLLFVLAAAATATAAQAPASDPPKTLDPGATLERAIAGGQQHLYRLPLAAGDVTRLTVEQHGVDVLILVLDQADKLQAEFDIEWRTTGREPVIVQ